MNRFITTLDKLTTASLPYAAVTTVLLIITKLLGYTSYSWLLALAPALIGIFAVGVVNFLSFFLDQD